jgi:hypothetical protein
MIDIMIGIGECHLDSDDFASLYQPDFSLKILQMLSGDCGGAVAQPPANNAQVINDNNPASFALMSIAANGAA